MMITEISESSNEVAWKWPKPNRVVFLRTQTCKVTHRHLTLGNEI